MASSSTIVVGGLFPEPADFHHLGSANGANHHRDVGIPAHGVTKFTSKGGDGGFLPTIGRFRAPQ
jgi:hypothetical protein